MKVLGICGSATSYSSNHIILQSIQETCRPSVQLEIYDRLGHLPHFDTALTDTNVPEIIIDLRNKIDTADALIISSPEYIFSIPSRLKNALEWCVSVDIFRNKPVAIITASTQGNLAHEQLQMILKTIGANIPEQSTLLIPGIKGKIQNGKLDDPTSEKIKQFFHKFIAQVNSLK